MNAPGYFYTTKNNAIYFLIVEGAAPFLSYFAVNLTTGSTQGGSNPNTDGFVQLEQLPAPPAPIPVLAPPPPTIPLPPVPVK